MNYPKRMDPKNGDEHEGTGEIPTYDKPSLLSRVRSRQHEENERKQETRGQNHDGELPCNIQKHKFFSHIQTPTA
jgi:hypothetical protein